MSSKILHTILFISIISNLHLTGVAGEKLSTKACNLKVLSEDYDQWHDLAEGFVYGMYKAPPAKLNDCWYCDNIGRATGSMQRAVASLE